MKFCLQLLLPILLSLVGQVDAAPREPLRPVADQVLRDALQIDGASLDQVADGRWWGFGGIDQACNGLVAAMEVLENGDLLLGGSFTVCGGVAASRVAIYSPASDSFSVLGSGANNGVDRQIRALAVSGSTIYVGGYFKHAGGIPANGVAKFSNGQWSSLGTGSANGVGNLGVNALALDGDDLYVAGSFSEAGGATANNIARWDGSAWSTLGTGNAEGISGTVRGLVVGNGRLYACGFILNAGDISLYHLAQWDGVSWAAVGDRLTHRFNRLDALHFVNGELYVGGQIGLVDGVLMKNIARWNGSSWNPVGSGDGVGLPSYVRTLISDQGVLYAGGEFRLSGGVARFDGANWQLLADSLPDGGADNWIRAMAVVDGELIVGGRFDRINQTNTSNLARLGNGSWSGVGLGAGNGVNGTVFSIAVAGNSVYIAGSFSRVGGVVARNVAHWDGSRWSSLGTGQENGIPDAAVNAIMVSGNNVYVAGAFTKAGSVDAIGVARWDGAVWSAMGTGPTGVSALVIAGGQIYAAGYFSEIAGEQVNNIVRWDGFQWVPLQDGAFVGVNGGIYDLDAEGNDLYAAGAFTQAGAAGGGLVSRWNGNAWSRIGSPTFGFNGAPQAIAVGGGKVYIAGQGFNLSTGVNTYGIIVNDGVDWSTLAEGVGIPGNTAYSLAATDSGVFVGGSFQNAGSLAAYGVAYWDGSRWTTLGRGVVNGANDIVYAMAVDGTELHIGGRFGKVGGLLSSNVAKWRAVPGMIFSSGIEEE